jgi:hypothetical protein
MVPGITATNPRDLGLLMLFILLLWSEWIESRDNNIFFKKDSAAGLRLMCEGQDATVFPAGHGSEVEYWLAWQKSVAILLSAGLGGEGEGVHSLLLSDSCLRSRLVV